jgi:hypothetical protein
MRGAWFFVVLVAATACARDWSFEVRERDAAAGGSGGGTGVDGGTCFPGAKACPDSSGKVMCLKSDSPETGCKSSSCDPCVIPHATAACAPDGACAVGSCDTSWADCNSDPIDGCEDNLDATDTACGSCDNDCIATDGPNWICDHGTCAVNACCPNGACSLRDCDGDKGNGCEADLTLDPNNCGACGTVCNLAHATAECASSACQISQCDTGYSDCDGNAANGCEVNVINDTGNCGACGKACASTNGSAACVGGVCQILCNSGFADCDNNPNNGCEINTAVDPAHCGGCANACAPQHVNGITCSAGACGFTSCLGAWDDCDGNAANGCETSLTASTSCGACATVCSPPTNGTATCLFGNCSVTCNSGYHSCSGACYATDDPTHCGAGCTNCPGPTAGTGTAVCSGGCSIQCSGSTPNKCQSGCYDFQTDKNHCGSCFSACFGAKICVNGKCT